MVGVGWGCVWLVGVGVGIGWRWLWLVGGWGRLGRWGLCAVVWDLLGLVGAGLGWLEFFALAAAVLLPSWPFPLPLLVARL